jgi:hypothetical protein
MLPAISIPSFLTSVMGTIGDGHHHEAWRYTLMSGLIPAIPLIIIRPFLPESPAWKAKKESGQLKRPSIGQLFAPNLRRTTIVTAIGFACTLGAAFGAIQQMPQVVPGLKDVQEKATAKAQADAEKQGVTDEEELAKLKRAAVGAISSKTAAQYTKVQEVGGLIGRFLMALALAYVVRWGWTLRMFQIPALILTPLLFYFFLRIENRHYFDIDLTSILLGVLPITTISLGMFFIGLFTVAQLSFWGNYLPHAYPVHLRGTGESFAANIGGRLIGTSAAAVSALVASVIPAATGPMQFATAAAIVGGGVCAIGLVASFFLPEPQPENEHA